jgi:hypothetical protein
MLAQSSGGTLTSDHVGLGDSDADARWIGVRRHQAMILAIAVGLLGEGVLTSRVRVVALSAAFALAACAVPINDGRTLGEQCVVATRYLTRAHWRAFNVRELGDEVVLWYEGEVTFRTYELSHRGRLDLSERDVVIAESLSELADAASASRSGQHLSQHVVHTDGGVVTVLALPVDVTAPEGWLPQNSRVFDIIDGSRETSTAQLFERFSYVRTKEQLVRIFRVRDFSSVPIRRGLLEQVLRSSSCVDVALHLDVVGGATGQRLASRAVHRVGSDDETSRSAGFRRTARTSRNFARLAQRETLVASGRSLLRVAVFIVVRGETLNDIQRRSAVIWRHAHDAGLRLDRGRGLQSAWYRAHLPGGPGW